MGDVYTNTSKNCWTTYLNDTHAIVEIGSDNFEGSTEFYVELANKYNIPFYTVDLNPEIEPRLREQHNDEFWKNTSFVLANGSEWTKTYNGPKIHTLYLDNFDWDWNKNDFNKQFYNEVLTPKYKEAGFELNNINSVTEHLKQMMNILPHMADDCVVCIDDTPKDINHLLYTGKGAGVVIYLLALGFIIAENSKGGVILVRGKYKDLQNYICVEDF